jgi:integron integrase
MGSSEIREFLTSLAIDKSVGASTQNQALCALLFLYREVLDQNPGWIDDVVRAKPPRRLPEILSGEEVRAVLDRMHGTPRLMCMLLYGAELRLMECATLRVKDLDFRRNEIIVRRGKGGRDRRTMLPGAVQANLREHPSRVRAQHREDLRRGAGWVATPDALGSKFPGAGREWTWHWAFPAARRYRDPGTRQIRRHHLHETVVQRAVRVAVQRAGLSQRATCHTFRHSFATHLLKDG